MSKWAIKAIFYNEAGEQNFTYYEEKTYLTRGGAMRAINGNYGEELAELATIDSKNEEDLQGFWLDDLNVYEIKKEKK